MPTLEPPDQDDRRSATRDWADMSRASATSLSLRAKAATARSAVLRSASARARRDRVRAGGNLSLRTAFGLAGIPLYDVWIEYASLGGDRSVAAITDYVAGQGQLPPFELRILAHALNEHFMDSGIPSLFPYDP